MKVGSHPEKPHLDNLEVVKYLSDIFARHHGIVGVLSIQVFSVGTVGIRLSFTPDVLEVLLQLHFRNVADLVSCFNVFLNVVFAVLRSLGQCCLFLNTRFASTSVSSRRSRSSWLAWAAVTEDAGLRE
jgi:hypothetical protein